MTNIFASNARQRILDSWGIKYKIDENLNFCFKTEAYKQKAIEILKANLEL